MSAAKDKAITPAQDPAASTEGLGGVFRLENFSPPQDGAPSGGPGASASGVRFSGKGSAGGRLSKHFVLLGLVVFGGAVLYGMRLIGIGPLKGLADGQVTVDYNLSDAGASKTSEHTKMLGELNANHIAGQVPVDHVQRNPFRMAQGLVKTVEAATIDDGSAKSADRVRREAELRRGKVESQLANLKVNSVLAGSNPVARIGGETVRVGDTVAEIFIVKAIHGRGVELVCDGREYSLSIDDDSKNDAKPRRK
jgi:hypothetical protein